MGTAALNLVYVADMAKARTSPENQAIWVPADAGFIAEEIVVGVGRWVSVDGNGGPSLLGPRQES